MIPKNAELYQNIEIETDNTLTHRMNIEKERVLGKADNIEAVQQAVYIMLNVERYDYVIFSPNFGVELKDLFGLPIPYCISEIKRRVKECLLMDDRITDVKNFEFETDDGKVLCTFDVITIYGEWNQPLEVNV